MINRVTDGFVHPKPPACPAIVYADAIRPCLVKRPHERPTFSRLGQILENDYDALSFHRDDGLALALSSSGSRDLPTQRGAWVNYDPGRSHGRGDGRVLLHRQRPEALGRGLRTEPGALESRWPQRQAHASHLRVTAPKERWVKPAKSGRPPGNGRRATGATRRKRDLLFIYADAPGRQR